MNLHFTAARRFFRPWLVVAALCLIYIAVTVARYGGIMELIYPQQAGAEGYDGQFTYLLAKDTLAAPERIASECNFALPFHGYKSAPERVLARLMDCEQPAYRLQRMLHGTLARGLSLGQPTLVPWAMLAVSLVALVAGVWSLETLLAEQRACRWFALVYGLFPGIFFAVRVSTTEPLAYGLVLLGILAMSHGQEWLGGSLLGLAGLAKETTLVFVAGYFVWFILSAEWRRALRFLLTGALPFSTWQVVLLAWVGQFGVGSGGAGATPFEVLPFNGIWRIGGIQSAQWRPDALFVLMLFPVVLALIPTLYGLYRSARDFAGRRWHPYVFVLGANALVMPFVPLSTYVEPLGTVRFLPGLVIGVLLYAALRHDRRALMLSVIWIAVGVLFLR